MNDFTFSPDGWKDYTYWQNQDRKTLKKINDLLEDIQRNGLMKGMGKPEPLKYRTGAYSRKINEKDRLVYEINDLQDIHVLKCRGHYNDK